MEKKDRNRLIATVVLIVLLLGVGFWTNKLNWWSFDDSGAKKEKIDLVTQHQIKNFVWNNCLKFSCAESREISKLLKRNILLQAKNDSLIKVIKSLKSEELILNKKIKKCSQSRRPVRKVIRRRPIKRVIRKKPVKKATMEPIAAVVKTPKTVKTISNETAKLTGLSDFVLFSVRLNGNEGNWFPQIAYDRNGKKFSYTVENPTGDGMNFKIKRSEFTNEPSGDISVTKAGKIYLKKSVIAPYLRKKKIVEIVVWTGTVKGFQKMSQKGDYWVYPSK